MTTPWITARPQGRCSRPIAPHCRQLPLAFAAILAAFTGVPAFAQTVTGLSCLPQTIIAPGTSTCTITINQAATPGFFVNILAANGDAVTPPTLAIPTGASSAQFTATVGNVPYNEVSTIEVFINLSTQLFALSITAQPQVTQVACGTASLAAGQTTTCTVTINEVQTSSAIVNLASSSASLTVPSTVTVPSGSLSATFTALAGAVSKYQPATITAQWVATITSTVSTVVGLGPTASGSLIVSGVTDAADNWSTNNCSALGWRTIAGGGFTSAPAQSSTPATTLGGVQVTVNGTPAPLAYASGSLVTFQCPDVPAGTPLQVNVTASTGNASAPVQTEAAVNPSIFVVDSARNDQGLVLIRNSDFLAMPQTDGVASTPVVKGNYVSIFATGLGELQGSNPAVGSNSVRVWIGGLPVTPIFVGSAQPSSGVFQVIAQIPAGVQSGSSVPLYLEVDLAGGLVLPSNQVMIAVN